VGTGGSVPPFLGENRDVWLKLTPNAFRIALQAALVSLLAYWAGSYFTRLVQGSESQIGALWATISGVVVLQATRRETVASAWLRVLGSLIGAIVSAAYLSLFPFSPLGMAFSIGITVILCYTLRVPDHARLASITVAVIMVVSMTDPRINPFMNAGLRFGESCIGAALAVLAVLAWSERT
jgi:uncharacterized membrane protein YgaE (UPF0421/DUF939 family)